MGQSPQQQRRELHVRFSGMLLFGALIPAQEHNQERCCFLRCNRHLRWHQFITWLIMSSEHNGDVRRHCVMLESPASLLVLAKERAVPLIAPCHVFLATARRSGIKAYVLEASLQC